MGIGLQGEGHRLKIFLAWHTVEKHYECFQRCGYCYAGDPSQSVLSVHSTLQWYARQGRFYNRRPWPCNLISTHKSFTLSGVNRTSWGVKYYSEWIKESGGKAWYYMNNAWERERNNLSLHLAEHRNFWDYVFFCCFLAGLCTLALESLGLHLLLRNLKGLCVCNYRICT